MNIIKKIAVLALLAAASLHAAPTDLATTVANLNSATSHLKAVAGDIKDPQLKKLIEDALKSAAFISRAGKKSSPQMATKALMKVQKVLAAIEKQQKPHFKPKHSHHRSSSSSSESSLSSATSCDVCSEISGIASDVAECCEAIKAEIQLIIDTIEMQFPCEMTNAINSVPVVINQPGKYCVVRDLVYNGPNTAITVAADNVTINFQNHSLTLTNANAQGILAQDVSEFTLENDIIAGSAVFQTNTSVAIHLDNVQKATLSDLYTKNTTTGIWVEDSTDIQIQNCLLENHESSPVGLGALPSQLSNGAAIWISDSNGVSIDRSVFQALDAVNISDTRSNTALVVDDSSENIAVSNCDFQNWLSTIYATSVDGLLVDHCQVIAHRYSPAQFVQLGDCQEAGEANDVIIRNSIFRKEPNEAPFFDGLLFIAGSGCLLENVIVDATCLFSESPTTAAFHIGLPGCGTYSNVLARDCIFTGLSDITVFIDSGNNITIEDSEIRSDNAVAVRMSDAADCLVKGCSIHGASAGVILNTTGKNAIMNNRVFGSTDTGILVEDNVGNHISGNTVYSNSNGIVVVVIPEEIRLTETYFNTSCNNYTQDCINVFPDQLPNDLAAAGSNICCDEA